MNIVDLVLTGELLPNGDAQKAALGLARITGLRPDKASELLSSGKALVAKRGLTLSDGEAWQRKFAEAGLVSVLKPSLTHARPESSAAENAAPVPQASLHPKPTAEPITASVPKEAFSANIPGILRNQVQEAPKLFDLALSGVLPGANAKNAAVVLARISGREPEEMAAFLSSGQTKVIKHSLGPDEARMYRAKLERMGLAASIRPAAGREAKIGPKESENRARQIRQAQKGWARMGVQKNEAAQRGQQEVTENTAFGEKKDEGLWRDTPGAASTGGLGWMREACLLFSERATMWLAVSFVLMYLPTIVLFPFCLILLMVAPDLQQIPAWISASATVLAAPGFVGGMAYMAERQTRGEYINLNQIFSGFWNHFPAFLTIGLCNLCYLFVLAAVGHIFGQNLLATWPGRFILFSAGILLCIPLSLGFLFAPTLVVFPGEGGLSALVQGLKAGLSHCGAFFSTIHYALPLGLLVALLLTLALSAGGHLFFWIFLLPCLPLCAILGLMGHVAARDLFYEETA